MSAPQPGSPLPWSLWHGDIIAEGDERSDHDDYVIAGIGTSIGSRSSTYSPVRHHKTNGKANAAYIVHACNNYPKAQAMADALRDMLEMRELHFRDRGHTKGEMQVVAESRAALAAWDVKP